MTRLPAWIYWVLAALALVAAAYFTFAIDTSALETSDAARLYFTIWGGPLTLVIGATLITWFQRSKRS